MSVVVNARLRLLRIDIETCPRERWLDQDGANVELPNFMVKRFGQSLQGMLAAGIKAHIRCGEEAEDRADIDDQTGVLLPHRRQYRSYHAQWAKEIGFKKGLRLIVRRAFDRPDKRDACIVHHDINPA
ncbi:hypothetical protein D3C80_1588770 [compost metagenome]